MNTNLIGAIIVVIIVLAGGWYLYSQGSPAPATDTAGETTSTGAVIDPQSQNVVVTHTAQGFSPASVTIPQGASIIFSNQSSEGVWVASAMHPAHSGYDGTTKDQHCAAGYSGAAPFDSCKSLMTNESFTFTFDKAGTWKYHNHADATQFGIIIVTAPNDTIVEGSANVSL